MNKSSFTVYDFLPCAIFLFSWYHGDNV